MMDHQKILEWLHLIAIVCVLVLVLSMFTGCGKAGDLLYGDDGADENIYVNEGSGTQIIGDGNAFSESVPAPAPTPTPEP